MGGHAAPSKGGAAAEDQGISLADRHPTESWLYLKK